MIPSYEEYFAETKTALDKWALSVLNPEVGKMTVQANKTDAQTLISSWKTVYPHRSKEIDKFVDHFLLHAFD